MTADITDQEWRKMHVEHFEVASLLRAVSVVDQLGGDLNGVDGNRSPSLRHALVNLHQLATAVFHDGTRNQVADLFNLAVDTENQIFAMIDLLEKIRKPLSQLVVRYPESLMGVNIDESPRSDLKLSAYPGSSSRAYRKLHIV